MIGQQEAVNKMSRKSYQCVSTADSISDSKSGSSQSPKVVYLDENGNECKEPRVRKVVSAQARHVTVVSYSRRHKETHKHTSHHVTTVRWA